jgi:tetrapyrrole methylase family protein/MazG family protein
MNQSSLVIVGSGIKFLSHLTVEAKANITHADKVLYLVNEPAIKEWICAANKNAESLSEIYFEHNLRIDSYKAITQYIVCHLGKIEKICVVLYGHPCVYAKPALDAVCEARRLGYSATILPGVSAEDCLFADLLIDPGSHGCQSFDATDMLISRGMIDVGCHLIVWQVGVIGALGHAKSHDNRVGLRLLTDYLIGYYGNEHEIIVYDAAQYPGFDSLINHIKLSSLPDSRISRISTLYVPPIKKRINDEKMMKLFGITL